MAQKHGSEVRILTNPHPFALRHIKLTGKSHIIARGTACTTKNTGPPLPGRTTAQKRGSEARILTNLHPFALRHIKLTGKSHIIARGTACTTKNTGPPLPGRTTAQKQGSEARILTNPHPFCTAPHQTHRQITHHSQEHSLHHKKHGSTASWRHHGPKTGF